MLFDFFWVLNTCLAMATKRGWYQLVENIWRLSSFKKIESIPRLFFEILLRYCKFVVLGILSKPGHTYQWNSINFYQTLLMFIYLHVYLKYRARGPKNILQQMNSQNLYFWREILETCLGFVDKIKLFCK